MNILIHLLALIQLFNLAGTSANADASLDTLIVNNIIPLWV